MTNPYAILVVVLFWLVSCVGAGWLGYDYRGGKAAIQQVEAVNDALSKARAQAATDLAAAVSRAATEAISVERARKAKAAGVRDAVVSARADCARSDESMRLLNMAIDAIRSESTPGSLRLKMSSDTQTTGR